MSDAIERFMERMDEQIRQEFADRFAAMVSREVSAAAADIKERIVRILSEALSGHAEDGSESAYLYRNGGEAFVRWGRVERDLMRAVDESLGVGEE